MSGSGRYAEATPGEPGRAPLFPVSVAADASPAAASFLAARLCVFRFLVKSVALLEGLLWFSRTASYRSASLSLAFRSLMVPLD